MPPKTGGMNIMIKVPSNVLAQLCLAYQTTDTDITYLDGGREDSDGIAYTYYRKDKKMVLKILAMDKPAETDLNALEERLKHVNYLGSQGIDIAYPVENSSHALYVTQENGKHIFVAYAMNFYEGENPKTDLLTTKLSYHWGKVIGKSHRVTKAYDTWKNFNSKPSEYGYIDEINFFTDWCKDDFVKNKWIEMRDTLGKLPINRNSYGFIHNDNHQRNIIVKDSHITLIDFDCFFCQFFVQDITVPVQGILFDLSGGMFNEVYNKEPIKRYFDEFLNGYESENHLDDFWLTQIDTFINYRRLLLFTCMQGYLNTNEQLKKGFIDKITDPVEIFKSL
jgi:Ser/Thr protein kinase RdoA (MazF antagonist)